jgi:hypothetical protein
MVLKGLDVRARGILIPEMLDHLNRAMNAIGVVDEAANEADHDRRRRRPTGGGGDGFRRTSFPEGKDQRKENQENAGGARATHSSEGIIARSEG